MDGDLYERDFYTWTRVQAEALRRLAAERPNLDAALDLPNLIEEIDCLGSEQVAKVRGHLAQMLEHLIYLATRPEDDAVRAWRREVIAFRDGAVDPYLPSMRRVLEPDLDKVWRRACRAARAKLDQPLRHLPEACPFDLDRLLEEDAPLEPLIVHLAPPPDPT
jgi:hypothetical protein